MAFGPQGAVIANPAPYHLEVALPLARAGVPLLIEKPISHDARGVSDLIDICEAGGLTLMTGYNLRYMSSLQTFRELLRDGRIGRSISVRAEVGQSLTTWRPGVDYRSSVSAKAELGGGVLPELSHDIDYLRWLFGEAEWVSATLVTGGGLDIEVEDVAHLVIGYAPRNSKASVVAALSMDFIRHDTTRGCTVIGEAGSLRWDGVAGTVEVFDRGEHSWQSLFTSKEDRDSTYLEEWRDFLRCIGGGGAPLVSGRDGLATVRLIEAARVSAESRCVVHCGAGES